LQRKVYDFAIRLKKKGGKPPSAFVREFLHELPGVG